MSNSNIFRQAKNLLDNKGTTSKMSDEELEVVNTALIPLMVNTNGFFPDDMTIAEGLEELAQLVEEKLKGGD